MAPTLMKIVILSKYVANGLSTYKISAISGKSQTTIRYWLKKFGLKTMPKRRGYDYILCPRCNKTKYKTEFYFSNGKRKRVTGYCKSCNNSYCTQRSIGIKIKMIQYAGGKCLECGLRLENSHYAVFDFHHRESESKEMALADMKNLSWNKILVELNKCDLLCANCHRLKHAKMAN